MKNILALSMLCSVAFCAGFPLHAENADTTLKTDIAVIKTEIRNLNEKMDDRFKALDGKIDDRFWGLENALIALKKIWIGSISYSPCVLVYRSQF